MCMIRLQRHMGAVALMGPGSDAEWDWLPTELGCCCPESESNTHNANVSAKLTDARAWCSRGPTGQRNTGSCRCANLSRGCFPRDCVGECPGLKKRCTQGLGHREGLSTSWFRMVQNIVYMLTESRRGSTLAGKPGEAAQVFRELLLFNLTLSVNVF